MAFEEGLVILMDSIISINSEGNIPKTGKKPKFSDIKVMALSLAAEFMSVDSENRLFNILNDSSFFNNP